ncbi:MAG TPA: hypothetical protein VM118_02270 [Acidobacteriota bacterium]|nr:hypothetical protein [Acidobacteriota bacterium]
MSPLPGKRALIVLCAVTLLAHCGGEKRPAQAYDALPLFEREVVISEGFDTLRPSRLLFHHDTLYVGYNGVARIDLFSPDLKRIGKIFLNEPVAIVPTAFAIADSEIVVCDHAHRAVALFDRTGIFKTSFGKLPDRETPLSPLAVAYYGGVMYVTDISLQRVLAISLADAPGITERGELILSIPADTTDTVGFPSAVHVTPDGRLLVGDADNGLVRVFTCDGRPVYSFDTVPTALTMAPMAFAVDDVVDPSLQDTASFDPSDVHAQGRYHVVDANNATVHMFNPLGRYIASYPLDKRLVRPSGVAIDPKTARVFVADPQAARVFIYRYRGRPGRSPW